MQLVLPTPAAFVLGGRNMHLPAQHIKTAPPPVFFSIERKYWRNVGALHDVARPEAGFLVIP